MKKMITLLNITCFIPFICLSQHFDSIQKDIQYSIEKVFFSVNKEVSSNTCFYFLIIETDQPGLAVTMITSDTSVLTYSSALQEELAKRKSLYKCKTKYFVPVFFLSKENESISLSKQQLYSFMESFKLDITGMLFMRRIILFAPQKVR